MPEAVAERTVLAEILDKIIAHNPTFHVGQMENEDQQVYFKRLMNAVYALPEPIWNSLSPDVQMWYNTATDRSNTMQPVPAPQGYHTNEGETPMTATAAPATETPVEQMTNEQLQARVKELQEKLSKKGTPKEVKPKRLGIMAKAREIAIQHRDFDAKKIHVLIVQEFGEEKAKLSTATLALAEVNHVLESIKNLNGTVTFQS